MVALAYSRLFWQGASLGWRGFSALGIQTAGLKRTLGFVLQPVENWSRYPELYTVQQCLGNLDHKKVLDLGSPKMLGLLLAEQQNVDLILTDIWDCAIRELGGLFERNKPFLKGRIEFQTADLTKLPSHLQSTFDAVYSVSVVEHIESMEAIQAGLQEMARVTKPGGIIVVSVPIRKKYFQDYRQQSVYGRDDSQGRVFFSHYFDQAHACQVFADQTGLKLEQSFISRWRVDTLILRFWRKVPQKVRGFLGVMNMLLAPWVTEIKEVSCDLHSLSFPDEGDLILKFRRL